MNTPDDAEENKDFSNQNAMVANLLGPLLSQASNDSGDVFQSSPESPESIIDLKTAVMDDEVTAQLATSGSGLVGVAAASAIASVKKRHRFHSFETNPVIRKRQQSRILKKLRHTVDEFATRIGQQAVVLVVTPSDDPKSNSNYKVFGAQPLEGVIKKLQPTITENLKYALEENIPVVVPDNPCLFELPPINIDGMPTSVAQMTQAQLRAFIPLMLKYSTGRGKPGWGKETHRPLWWPKEIPWENIRIDIRPKQEKKKMSWTHALRQIIYSCYKFHGREDLINKKSVEKEEKIETQILPPEVHITNADIVSPNNIITIPDSTTPTVQILDSTQQSNDEQTEIIALSSISQASLKQDGQICLISGDGHRFPITISGVITLPSSFPKYQTMESNTDTVSPSKLEETNRENIQTLGMAQGFTHQVMIEGTGDDPPQVLQVLSLQEGALLTIDNRKNNY